MGKCCTCLCSSHHDVRTGYSSTGVGAAVYQVAGTWNIRTWYIVPLYIPLLIDIQFSCVTLFTDCGTSRAGSLLINIPEGVILLLAGCGTELALDLQEQHNSNTNKE